jgi:ribA/ribD-fused uncharacterized protein
MAEQFYFFWSNDNPFSQWHRAEFVVDGITYNCAEQYMMWGKAVLFGDEEMAAEILKATNPRKQKQLGRKVRNFNSEVWNQHARDIVFKGNWAKFTQNEHLKQHLLSTVGKTIVEAAPNDRVWGIGLAESDPRAHNRKTWQGKNWLGEVLTRVREELRASAAN